MKDPLERARELLAESTTKTLPQPTTPAQSSPPTAPVLKDALERARELEAAQTGNAPTSISQGKPTMGERIKEGAIENAPAIGGVAGEVVGGIPGGIAGGVVGSVVRDVAKGQPISPVGAALEGASQGVQGVGGAIVEGGVRAGGRILTGPLAEGAAAAEEFLTPAARAAGLRTALLPGEKYAGGWVDFFQALAEGSISSRRWMRRFKERRTEAVEALVDRFRTTYGPVLDSTEIGRVITRRSNKLISVLREAEGSVWEPLMSKVGAVGVDVRPLQNAFAKASVDMRAAGIEYLDPEGINQMIKLIESRPQTMTLEQLKQMRTNIGALVYGKNVADRERAKAVGGELYKRIDKLMRKELRILDRRMGRTGPDSFLTQFRMAQRASRQVHEVTDLAFVRTATKLANQRQEGYKIIGRLVSRDNVEQLTSMRRLYGANSPEWRNIQGWIVDHILTQATSTKTGLPRGDKLLGLLNGKAPGTLGKRFVHEALDPETITNLKKLSHAMKVIGTQPGTGGVQIALVQAGMLAPLFYSPNWEGAKRTGYLLMTPPVLGLMMRNPKMASMILRKGARLTAASAMRMLAPLGTDVAQGIRIISNEQGKALLGGKSPKDIDIDLGPFNMTFGDRHTELTMEDEILNPPKPAAAPEAGPSFPMTTATPTSPAAATP